MYRIFRCLLFFLFIPVASIAQADSLVEIKGLHTKQIYDLMIDSRGFLWIGHDLGLSRYDGTSFTLFSSPQQNSLGVSDILEDKQGRIWCRNFSSQIFYVENEKMNLLSSYDYLKEKRFPHMVLVGDKLIATSVDGLFVLNTSTMKSHFVNCGNRFISSLSKVNDKIVAFGEPDWYYYDPAGPATAVRLSFNYPGINSHGINLQTVAKNDSFFSFSSSNGRLTRFVLKDNAVIILDTINSKGFLNTVVSSGDDIWIHSTVESKTINGSKLITGYDLSDLATDKEGNTWYSSTHNGLLVRYRNYWKKIGDNEFSYWENIAMPLTRKDENVLQIARTNKIEAYATSEGRIILKELQTGRIIREFKFPPQVGSLQFMKMLNHEKIFVATSLNIYIIDDNYKNLELLYAGISAKNAVEADSSIYFSAASGLFEIKINNRDSSSPYSLIVLESTRSRWVEYDYKNRQLVVAFKDGLATVKNDKITPILFNGSPVAAITIMPAGNKFYISTFGQGMFCYGTDGIKKLNVMDEYKSNPVFKIRMRKDTAWLCGPGFLTFFDSKTERRFEDVIIPGLPETVIYDLDWIGDKPALFTGNGIYTLHSNTPDSGYLVKNYLVKISINGNDTVGVNKLKLPYKKNSLEFLMSVPFYTNPEIIYFQYRLVGSGDEEWKTGENGVHRFLFSSLSPGKYRFEARAIHPQFGIAASPVSVDFEIIPLWYATNLSKLLFSVLLTTVILLLVSTVFRSRLRKQKSLYEKHLAVDKERERISAEIHDDIGAGLSGVRLLTELTGNKINNPEAKIAVEKIYNSITELSTKMQEVIWSLNAKNDRLDNLLRYIQKQSVKLLEHSNKKLVVHMPESVPVLEIGSEMRADIYLTVKEAIHNALKHSTGEVIDLNFSIVDDRLVVSVTDIGNGIKAPSVNGNGLLNMKKRMDRLGGRMELINENGLKALFDIPLK